MRDKQDIQPLRLVEKEVVDDLIPISYREDKLQHYGFLVKDVEETLEDLGIWDSALVQKGSDGTKRVAHEELIPLLVDEVQTLKRQVRILQTLMSDFLGG
ncbi:MAG: tail fiber domain-containing protein [Lachnospiraceae bacterium]|nr:tail fiber domain-containing protein [Lachnospiraceae bacterium]